jgi:hypothetical protein
MTNLNTKPVVATSNPEIYENHTYHMSRATPFTYNYAGVIEVKHLYLTKASRTKKEYLQSWNKTNELYKELMALDDTALAG